MLMMLYWKKRKTFLGVKKAVGFPVFYRTLQTLAGQAFRRSSPSKRRTELVAGETKKPENRRGFPFYSSGASNPKGSGAQYCSPPTTVLGIELHNKKPAVQEIILCCRFFYMQKPRSRSRRAQKGERFGRFAPRHDSRPEWSSIGNSSHRGRWPVRCRCDCEGGGRRRRCR